MAPASWEIFRGREDDQPGSHPLESVLINWAEEHGLAPVQAQALLCDDKLYAPSYRKKLLHSRELEPEALQHFNKSVPKEERATPAKFFLNPMHLLVQQAYFKGTVRKT